MYDYLVFLRCFRQHYNLLPELHQIIHRLDIDQTLATIGAIYSQLQLLGAKNIDSQRVSRLSTDVDEQVDRLDNLLDAMDDVYDSPANLE